MIGVIMYKSFSKKAGSLLQSEHHDLKSLMTKVKQLEKLNQKFIEYLPNELKNYCHVANINGNRLIIMAANGSIATQLRFQSPDILKKMNSNPLFACIKEIHCKVAMPNSRRLSKTIKSATMSLLSNETAALIRDFAKSLDDEKLR